MTRSRLFVALVVGLCLVGCASAQRDAPPSPEARQLVALINESRARAGLAPLATSDALDRDARAHAVKLARRQDLFHRSSREFRRLSIAWIRVGENVGTAGDVDEMHRLMMESPLHRANVLGPFSLVGVGIERDRRNRLWVTEVFVAQ